MNLGRRIGALYLVLLPLGCGGGAPPYDPSPVVESAPDAPWRPPVASGETPVAAVGPSTAPDGATAAATATSPTEAPSAKPAAAAPKLGYAPLWEVKDPGGWNHALAIAPSGDVLSLSAYDLTVLARHDGSRLDHARVCGDISLRGNALAVRGDRVLAVCSDAVEDVELRGMRRAERFKLPWSTIDSRATACGFGPTRLAVGNHQGEVLEIDLTSWRLLAKHQAPTKGEIEALGYSPDGALLAVSVDAEIGTPGQILLLRGGRFERLPNAADSSGVIEFAPSGRELFAEVRSFTAGRVSVVDGRVGREQHVSSWLTAARWVDAGLVAATGAHGTALFPAQGDQQSLSGETGEGLAVSKDGKLLCSGDRDGTIRCWSRGPVAPSTYRPLAPVTGAQDAAAPGAPSGPATGSSATEHSGRLQSRTTDRLVIALDGEPAPRPGASGELSKRVATNIGGLSITAWLTIAKVTVEKVSGKLVTVRIDEKTSQVNVNGKPLDHFTSGSELRLNVP